MQRYFFPIELNGESKQDDDGVELVDDAAAKREAIVTIAQLAAENIPHDGPLVLSVRVLDAALSTVFKTTVTFDFE